MVAWRRVGALRGVVDVVFDESAGRYQLFVVVNAPARRRNRHQEFSRHDKVTARRRCHPEAMAVKRFALAPVGVAFSTSMDSSKRPSETSAVIQEIVDEVSQAMAVKPPKRNGSGLTFWQYAGAVLAGVLAASAIAGGLGRAFFVDRPAYQIEIQANAVEHARIGTVIEQFERTMTAQTAAFEKLQAAVHAQAVELGKLERRR